MGDTTWLPLVALIVLGLLPSTLLFELLAGTFAGGGATELVSAGRFTAPTLGSLFWLP